MKAFQSTARQTYQKMLTGLVYVLCYAVKSYVLVYWVSGATMGGIFGSLITIKLEGLDFVMTAMFVVIFLEQWLKEKDHTSSLLGLFLSFACLLAFGADNYMIPSMLAIFIVLTLSKKRLEKGGRLQ